MNSKKLVFTLFVIGFLGCSGGSVPSQGGDTGKVGDVISGDSSGLDGIADTSDTGDTMFNHEGVLDMAGVFDTQRDGEIAGELTTDGVISDSGVTCPYNAGCDCKDNSECYSGFCIDTPDGGKCASTCTSDDSCPDDYKCSQVVNTQGDTVFICVYKFSNICRPCKKDDECANPYLDQENHCVSLGAEGMFCGSGCQDDTDCPRDYKCADVTVKDKSVKQCIPESGQCKCTDRYKNNGYLTTCYKENEFGKCMGERTCDSECDAPQPKEEVCNSIDDDCNGKTDDVKPKPCPITNEYGTCTGETVCLNGTEKCVGTAAQAETCDGKDNDCDGETDEDLGGGTCPITNSFGTCTGTLDCVDGKMQCVGQEPKAESCDGQDDNCNGETDEEGATGCVNYYKDADKDRYADKAAGSHCLCAPGEVNGVLYDLAQNDRKGDDCNDNDSNVHPGLLDAPETEPPFVDSNCDGVDGDAGKAVFVSASGSGAADCGTKEKPCSTISKGLAAAKAGGKKYVLVTGETYNEDLNLVNGIGIYGGYASDWTRDASNMTMIYPTSVAGVRAVNITAPTIVNLVEIQGKDGKDGSGETTYAFYAKNCSSALQIINCKIDAGYGGSGADGEDGPEVDDGGDGRNGSGHTGGRGGTVSCGANGGNGGSANSCNGNTSGSSGVGGAAGGAKGSNECSGNIFTGCNDQGGAGKSGKDGANGKNGASGSGGSGQWGMVSAGGLWVGANGRNGNDGTRGGGGGGGGAGGSDKDPVTCGNETCLGAGGGGGGAGGCGGKGGKGGQAGGGSFAVFLASSPIAITNCKIVMATGGRGGAGGRGSRGGNGGQGGTDGSPSCAEGGAGGSGGNGGRGGNGGGGGGGCGGVSVGIGYKGTAPTITAVTYQGGNTARGGRGGGSGNNGCTGAKANTHGW